MSSLLDKLPNNALVSRAELRRWPDEDLRKPMDEWLRRRCQHPTLYQYQSLLYVNTLLCEKELDRRRGTRMFSCTVDVTYAAGFEESVYRAAAQANYWLIRHDNTHQPQMRNKCLTIVYD